MRRNQSFNGKRTAVTIVSNRLWRGAGGAGADTGPYEHQLADHKRKILAQIGKAFEAQHGKKPQADQLRNLITAKHRACTRRTAADVSAAA